MKKFVLLFCFFLIVSIAAGSPARSGRIVLQQPDGTSFYARFYGDEYMKIMMTETGKAIVQDQDSWWCYAVYDEMGVKSSTGCRVGAPVSSDLLDAAGMIPFETLSRRALNRRRLVELPRLHALQDFRKFSSDDDQNKAKSGLVILAQFQDLKFKYTKQDFEKMLTQDGYSVNGATGSAKEYFEDQFRGLCTFSFDVSEIVTLNNPVSYYGENDPDTEDDIRPHKMIVDACQKADGEINFSKYDQDGDGEVDNVFVFFAGEDEAVGAGSNKIWSHAWYIKDGAGESLILDDVLINRYACTSELEGLNTGEIAGIGTFCHEYTHTLGLPDLYDTDYDQGGFAAALWTRTALMDGGNYNNGGNTPPYFNAIEREILGLSKPVLIQSGGTYEILPINSGVYYRIDTDTAGEYFLLEYRDGTGWDEYIGGKGMLLYHIDKSENYTGISSLLDKDVTAVQRWLNQLEINALSSHQCADLIEADGRQDAFTSMSSQTYLSLQKSTSGLFFPFGQTNALTPESTPGLKCWDNTKVNWVINEISMHEGKMSFRAVRYSTGEIPAPVKITRDIFQDKAIISFESSVLYDGNARIEYGPTDGERMIMTLPPTKPGYWAFILEDLQPTSSYTLKISFVSGDSVGDEVDISFMTRKYVSGALPHIYLNDVDRNEDGTFKPEAKLPLIVYNAMEAKQVSWAFDGESITREEDCYYRITRSGTLSATVYWEDGSYDVIVKELKVK